MVVDSIEFRILLVLGLGLTLVLSSIVWLILSLGRGFPFAEEGGTKIWLSLFVLVFGIGPGICGGISVAGLLAWVCVIVEVGIGQLRLREAVGVS